MLVKYAWITTKHTQLDKIRQLKTTQWEGWFVFGVLPLYIRVVDYAYSPAN